MSPARRNSSIETTTASKKVLPRGDGGGRRAPDETRRSEELLSVSSAARLLGVSVSSLRAWAAAGQVPHRRTRGGHRRFERAELERWLGRRGGELPEAASRAPELVPTRVAALPEVATALREREGEILAEAELVLAERGPTSRRRTTARRERLVDALQDIAEALQMGDLGPCLRESEWHGYRNGAAGRTAEQPVGEALALVRAIEEVACARIGGRRAPEARALRQALDRATFRVVTGYAAGLRSRKRAADGE